MNGPYVAVVIPPPIMNAPVGSGVNTARIGASRAELTAASSRRRAIGRHRTFRGLRGAAPRMSVQLSDVIIRLITEPDTWTKCSTDQVVDCKSLTLRK